MQVPSGQMTPFGGQEGAKLQCDAKSAHARELLTQGVRPHGHATGPVDALVVVAFAQEIAPDRGTGAEAAEFE